MTKDKAWNTTMQSLQTSQLIQVIIPFLFHPLYFVYFKNWSQLTIFVAGKLEVAMYGKYYFEILLKYTIISAYFVKYCLN